MLEFWVPALGLVVASGAALLAVLWRTAPNATGAEAADIRVYKDQLAEVERDLARGMLTPDDGARLRAEVARRLLEADRAASGTAADRTVGPLVPASLIALVLLASIGGYFWLGAPGYPDLPLADRLDRSTAIYNSRPTQEAAEAAAGITGTAPQNPDEADLLQRLRAAVAERPDDLQGHQLLAKSEMSVGNFPAARQAYQRAVELLASGATPQDHAALGEIMILAAGGIVTPQAEAELVATLKADPRNPVARFYSGLMLAQVGRPDQAFALWRPLLEESSPQDPWHEAIRSQIEAMAQAAGIDYVLPKAAGPGAKGPDAGAIAAAGDMTPEQRQEMIKGMVGGLEERLLAEGGTAEDWARLVNALGVLGEADRAATAFAAGQKALAGDSAGLAALMAAAKGAGVAP